MLQRCRCDVLDSKTIRLWLALLGIAFAMIVFATVAQHYGLTVPYVSDFFSLIGVGGGSATVRNIAADHAIPAWQATRLPPSITGEAQ